MARQKKTQTPEQIGGSYSAIPHIVLDSLAFKGATDKAKSILFALIRQLNGKNNGHLHLAKKWLSNQGWTCDEGNRKAKKELIERGLIVQTKQGGLNMGADLYAVTWLAISNFVGLDMTEQLFIHERGKYIRCTLPPTKRRPAPMKGKKLQTDERASLSSTTEQAC